MAAVNFPVPEAGRLVYRGSRFYEADANVWFPSEFQLTPPSFTFTAVDAGSASDSEVKFYGSPLDGFIQSAMGAVLRPALTRAREVSFSVNDFGAVGDGVTDDTAAINVAISACVATGIGLLDFPSPAYMISSQLLITTPIFLRARGSSRCIIRQTGATSNGICFDFPSLIPGGGIQGMTVEAGTGWQTAGLTASGSTGIGIRVTNSNGLFTARDIAVNNFDTGISVLGSWYTRFENFQVLFATSDGLLVTKSTGQTGGGNMFAHAKLSNLGFTGTNTASNGIRVAATGGDYFSFIDVTSFNKNIVLRPAGTDNVLYCFFSNVLGDTATDTNWEFDGTTSKVWSIRMVNCWGSFSTNGPGSVTKGANLDGIYWTGGALRENGTNGANLQGGVNVQYVGVEIASNSKLSANTSAGVQIDANVSSWGLIGCRIGNVASTFTGQADNVNIASGTSQNWRVTGCDLQNCGSGKVPLFNGSSSVNWLVKNNLPIQATGTNASDRISLTGGSGTSLPAAASTNYLGPFGTVGSNTAASFVVAKPGIVTGFYVAVGGAPGTSQTYTYTVQKNFVDTSMTGTISGNAAFSVLVTTNAFTVVQGDELTLKLVTSATAAANIHRSSIWLEP